MGVFGRQYREAVRRTLPFVIVMASLFVAISAVVTIWVASSASARAGIVPAYARDAIRRATGGRANLGIPPAGLSTYILLNNVGVAFAAFALGITLGIGTIYLVVQNAVLLGLLGGAYTAAGKAGAFWVLILPHGLLEISAVCLAAGAGLRMGWSVIDPGDRPRGKALATEARDAAMVGLGVIPAFGVAALIEGFVTGSSVPNPLELGIGAAAAAGYVAFLFWPRARPRGGSLQSAGRLDPQVLVGQSTRQGGRRLVDDHGAEPPEPSGRAATAGR